MEWFVIQKSVEKNANLLLPRNFCSCSTLRNSWYQWYLMNVFFMPTPDAQCTLLSMAIHCISSVQSLSRVRLCNPMNCSTAGLPVHLQLPEFTQTHVHLVSDAIQPSHPLSSPSPHAPNPSQHQSLFQWVNSLHEVAKVLEFQFQHQSFQWTPRTGLL